MMYDAELLERANHLYFYGTLEDAKPIELVNSSCGDKIKVYLKIKDGKIVDGRFSGVSCAISQVSADLFIESVVGKTLLEAKVMAEDFCKAIRGEKSDAQLGVSEAIAKKVMMMPARANCAKLAWKSLERL